MWNKKVNKYEKRLRLQEEKHFKEFTKMISEKKNED